MPTINSRPPKRSARKRHDPSVSSASWSRGPSMGPCILQVAAFSKLPWLIHAFSTAPGGISPLANEKVLNLGFTDWDTRENVQENRRLFQTAAGAKDLPLITLKQFHSDVIHLFDGAP